LLVVSTKSIFAREILEASNDLFSVGFPSSNFSNIPPPVDAAVVMDDVCGANPAPMARYCDDTDPCNAKGIKVMKHLKAL
jgi:hypothetical protein